MKEKMVLENRDLRDKLERVKTYTAHLESTIAHNVWAKDPRKCPKVGVIYTPNEGPSPKRKRPRAIATLGPTQ